jgi:hypothetical protein
LQPRSTASTRRGSPGKPGVLFADVTSTKWYETFQHSEGRTSAHVVEPLAATYNQALDDSEEHRTMFRAFSALPDERMKAQEEFFLGSSVPVRHNAPGVLGLNPLAPRREMTSYRNS